MEPLVFGEFLKYLYELINKEILSKKKSYKVIQAWMMEFEILESNKMQCMSVFFSMVNAKKVEVIVVGLVLLLN